MEHPQSGGKCQAGDLAFDAASVAVRSAALIGLAKLAENPLAQPLMKVVLPSLRPLIWDPALAVRTAMADLLLTIGYAWSLLHSLLKMQWPSSVSMAILQLAKCTSIACSPSLQVHDACRNAV